MVRASTLACCLVFVAALGCRSDPPATAPSQTGAERGPALAEFECGEEFPDHARCGDYEVFEDREARSGRTIALRWVVLPATGSTPAPDPVFVLAGGPGQAATDLVVLADTQLAGVNRTRDIVFVDQRGTGSSNGLRCVASELPDMMVGITAISQRETLAACREGWDADLRHYATTTAMADLDELRGALGYEQVNLWGVSYGTRAALEYLRRHESSVRSVLIWGLAPPHQAFPAAFADAGDAALDQFFAACAADPACVSVVPEGRQTLDAILARLEAAPEQVEVLDPRSGQVHEIEVDRQLFMTGVRLTLYDAGWSTMLPAMIAAAAEDDLSPMMRFVATFVIQIYAHIYSGMYLSVACSEDAPWLTEADLERAAASPFGERSLREIVEVCEDWPKAALPSDWREPVRSDVPVLVMNGGADPATPPSAAHATAQTLTRAVVVEFPNVSHGTSNAESCVNGLIQAFLDDPDPTGLDVGCAAASERPPF